MLTEQRITVYARSSISTAARVMVFWNTDEIEVLLEDGTHRLITEHDIVRAIANGVDSESRVGDLDPETL